ncbi:hypothetical protein GCM10012280_68090 [Wenjunlia tyrosinilytica]|uniref:Uncharacterized protein n=1 Tax=Wenjunlia tyrosinilytica TaxID=1544741 RepID=A0A918E1E5_9ACTN|nr:hypothetical protein GCM10012280_68090 [Wenjunlia tyrosinilytica]
MGGLADESGEASDAAGGALVEVGGVAGEGAGFVLLEVEVVFDVGDDVAEGLALAVAGGEGPQSMRVARPASWAPLTPVKRGVSGRLASTFVSPFCVPWTKKTLAAIKPRSELLAAFLMACILSMQAAHRGEPGEEHRGVMIAPPAAGGAIAATPWAGAGRGGRRPGSRRGLGR